MSDSSGSDQSSPVSDMFGTFQHIGDYIDLVVVADNTIVGVDSTCERCTSGRTICDVVVGRFGRDGSDVVVVKVQLGAMSFFDVVSDFDELPGEGSLGSTESIWDQDD